MEIKEALKIVSEGGHLTLPQAEETFLAVFKKGANQDQVGALLMGLKRNGENADEIAGAVRVLQKKAVRFNAPEGTIDICGTGGDGHNTLNISTAAAFVVAACGVPIAKHGNRAVSSACGSADVLEALGINIDVEPAVMERCLAETNFAFLYAPKYHPIMKEVAPIRKNLGFRTLFNLVGPLANPAQVKRQLIGVWSQELIDVFGAILPMIGVQAARIVHSQDGMDEVSVFAPTDILKFNGFSEKIVLKAADFITPDPTYTKLSISGGDAAHNATEIRKLFLNERRGAFKDMVFLNAAIAMTMANNDEIIQNNIHERIYDAIESGKAYELLNRVVEITNEHA